MKFPSKSAECFIPATKDYYAAYMNWYLVRFYVYAAWCAKKQTLISARCTSVNRGTYCFTQMSHRLPTQILHRILIIK